MENTETGNNAVSKKDLYYIDPRNIIVMEGWNSRIFFDEIDVLAEQIREQGVLNPISVQVTKVEGVEKYKLIDGERRYRAVMQLISEGVDITRIPALKLSASMSEEELLIQQFQRNEGKNFTEYEIGIFTRKMMDRCGKTITEVATAMCKNVGVVSYAVQLLELDPRVQELLKQNRISGSNVRRVYQCHPNDEEGAVQEIMGLQEKADSRATKEGEPTKLSLKDLDIKGRTMVVKDSTMILKGMKLLFKYYEESNASKFSPKVIISGLEQGKTIVEIFNEIASEEGVAMAKAE